MLIIESKRQPTNSGTWTVINDGVMGGRSQSSVTAMANASSFSGVVSPDNGGGFASIRTTLTGRPPAGLDQVVMRVRGDGKTYQFRVRTDQRWDGPSYKFSFDTTPGEWKEIVMPLREFRATFRGRLLSNASPLASSNIQQLGILIADEQFGAFSLEFADIRLQ